jgi:hypothetical protein
MDLYIMCHPELGNEEKCRETLRNNYHPNHEELKEEDDDDGEVLNARIKESEESDDESEKVHTRN